MGGPGPTAAEIAKKEFIARLIVPKSLHAKLFQNRQLFSSLNGKLPRLLVPLNDIPFVAASSKFLLSVKAAYDIFHQKPERIDVPLSLGLTLAGMAFGSYALVLNRDVGGGVMRCLADYWLRRRWHPKALNADVALAFVNFTLVPTYGWQFVRGFRYHRSVAEKAAAAGASHPPIVPPTAKFATAP